MSDLDPATFKAIFEGREFTKPKGTVIFVAEKLSSAEGPPYYRQAYVTMRNQNNGSTTFVRFDDVRHKWKRIVPITDKDEAAHEAAIDSVLGVPWYRQ